MGRASGGRSRACDGWVAPISGHPSRRLEIPAEKCLHDIQRYGNCSAASIPILLHEAVRDGLLRPGQLVAMTTFGSGFSWSCALARW